MKTSIRRFAAFALAIAVLAIVGRGEDTKDRIAGHATLDLKQELSNKRSWRGELSLNGNTSQVVMLTGDFDQEKPSVVIVVPSTYHFTRAGALESVRQQFDVAVEELVLTNEDGVFFSDGIKIGDERIEAADDNQR